MDLDPLLRPRGSLSDRRGTSRGTRPTFSTTSTASRSVGRMRRFRASLADGRRGTFISRIIRIRGWVRGSPGGDGAGYWLVVVVVVGTHCNFFFLVLCSKPNASMIFFIPWVSQGTFPPSRLPRLTAGLFGPSKIKTEVDDSNERRACEAREIGAEAILNRERWKRGNLSGGA